jgi:hypothetical protein
VDDFVTTIIAFIVGAFAGFIFTIFVTVKGELTSDDGYRKAYIDMHKGSIETVVQKQYPSLWIEYNVTKGKERGPE